MNIDHSKNQLRTKPQNNKCTLQSEVETWKFERFDH
jgi:hypothetical protein